MSISPALLVTLDLDEGSTAYFERQRRRFFPADRNRVPAHVMLFHRLPLERKRACEGELKSVATSFVPFAVSVGKARSIGKGVAYDIRADDLSRVHDLLARKWHDDLIAQDRETYRAHVVVQNKVSLETARSTLATLDAEIAPSSARAIGTTLWVYRNGFWEEPVRVPFG